MEQTVRPAQPKPLARELVDELRGQFRGRLLGPGDEGFDVARKVWNARVDRRPALIARCTGVADVVAGLRFARKHDLPLAVRGGGHNVVGFGVCDHGLVLDLGGMRAVRVDPKRRITSAQGGATWGDYDHENQLFGLGSPGGLISTTGVGGLTLGGGIGWLTRKHGLSCDSLRAAEVVTADAEVLRADEHQNADLFWALRGGGGNFGVVTSFEFEVYPVGTVTAGMVMFRAESARETMAFYREFAARCPEELTTLFAFQTCPPAPFLPATLVGSRVVAILFCHTGPAEAGEEAIRPLRTFSRPAADFFQRMPYAAFQCLLDAGGAAGLYNEWRSEFLRGLDDRAIETVVEHAGRLSASPFTMIHFHHLQGAVARVPEQATAFSHRQAAFALNIVPAWTDPAEGPRHGQWARELWAAMRPFSTGGAYVNFLDDEGEDRVQESYGRDKYARLAALKRKLDPDNFFRCNQNIRPAAG